MRFNVNHTVRVKLTEIGRAAHRRHHDEFVHTSGLSHPYRPPEEDADGWSTWQLWALMHEFGGDIYNGCKVPFETEIEIVEPADRAHSIAVEIGKKLCSQCCNRLDDPPKAEPCEDCPSDYFDQRELDLVAAVIRPHLNSR